MLDREEMRDFKHSDFHDVAKAIGEVTLAWNDLHDALGDLFWAVLGHGNGLIPGAVWHSIRLDSAQRDMLLALNSLNPKTLGLNIDDELRGAIKFILEEAKKLSERRNDAIHTPMARTDEHKVIPLVGTGHVRAQNLTGKDIPKELTYLYDATVILRRYAMDVGKASRSPSAPWPEKPKMPNRGDSKYTSQSHQG